MQQSCHIQVTASHERCSASGKRRKEIRPRGLRQLRHSELHWLDVARRVTLKPCMTVQKYLHSHAPSCVRRSPKRQTTRPSFGQPPSTRRAKYSSTRTAVVRSPWLVRPSGTPWATTCVIQNSASPASFAYWRRICFGSIGRIERIRSTVQ